MEDKIFDISVEDGGMYYKGWVNPSVKKHSNGMPASFHVVLNDTSFGYLSLEQGKWTAHEERPATLVKQVGAAIEKFYTMNTEKKQNAAADTGAAPENEKNKGSGSFNQGSEQDPQMNEGVADGVPHPEEVSKEKENPKSGKTG